MVKGMSATITGVAGVRRFIGTKEKNVTGSLKRALNLVGIHVQGEVKTSIAGQRSETKSVDTGAFFRSVDFKTGADSVSIFSKLPYAQKLEFGTNFKDSPRKHFRNTLAREKEKAKQIIQKEINKI